MDKAAKHAQTIKTLEGENLSAIIRIPKINVPMMNPNCTEEMT
ncbi:hypothetical protein I600_695 [Maribacter dokdonensis DSW-8]|nr:hypothetical protein I600_695 [Maribacter dokdonensis DSW-8]